ncbi:MAG: C45 family peptidase [Prosthecobacter sp.]|nr:C45 family peptidase [Prosthecobacter sp.]
MKFLRILSITALAAAAAGFLGYSLLTHLSPEQEALKGALTQVTAILEANQAKAFTATVEVLRAEGLPKELREARLEVCVALPDRLRLTTRIDGGTVVIGRNGDEIWAWREDKGFAVRATPGVPLFATCPEQLDTTRLAPLTLPTDAAKLSLVPALCVVKALPDELVDGLPCRVFKASPRAAARQLLGLGDVTLTLWLRADGFPVRAGYRDGAKTDVLIALHDVNKDARLPPETWQLPARAGVKVEHVALHHVQRFLEGSQALLQPPKLPALGATTGEKRVLATSGKGRLELHDGTRVLFLNGTPEEMGAQHGTLLGNEARNLVSRILYGVGVGSSLAKGEWFFGTIERCQARLQPFVDARFTREMDALASASGLTKEEIRLANFFPELFHCSGFALTGAATKGGRIYHGRVLDYMKGVGLEPNAVVMIIQPEQGHAWVNLGYAGFIGSVTAMNEAHISIGEMGGRGEGHWDGKPMAQLMREVMEKASTLDEAVAIMRDSPRTCEYYYVIADGNKHQAVGIKATHDAFEVVPLGGTHPQLDMPVPDTVLLSAGDRYRELVKRVKENWGKFDDESARNLMTRPVCMASNIQSVLFAPDTLDFWVANADGQNVASHTRYTHYNLAKLLGRTGATVAR